MALAEYVPDIAHAHVVPECLGARNLRWGVLTRCKDRAVSSPDRDAGGGLGVPQGATSQKVISKF